MPGHAATNVIDQQGALDPRGPTVDGNNAASLLKFPKVAQLAGRVVEAPKAADDRRMKLALEAKQAAMAGKVGPVGTPGPLGPRDLPGPAILRRNSSIRLSEILRGPSSTGSRRCVSAGENRLTNKISRLIVVAPDRLSLTLQWV
jgi:hypothetical protein